MTAPHAGDSPARHLAAAFPAVPDSVLSVPEIRDYDRINAELVQRLDAGQSYVRLSGAEGQRLLLAGLTGGWSALVEIEGDAGPELAAGLDCPGVTVVARGLTADGAGARLKGGRLILKGDTGDALGAGQEGGVILAARGAGHRAGLGQRGGVLVVLGPLGRLAGERQTGGRMFVPAAQLGPHAGHGRRGGDLLRFESCRPVRRARPTSASPATTLRSSVMCFVRPPPGSRRRARCAEKGPGGNMLSTRPYWSGPLAALLTLAAGCREELGPVPFATTRVRGQVVEAGRPVAGGWIEFVPVEGTVGNRRSAPLAADGRFEVSGVAVGRNVIGLVNAPIRMPLGGQLFRMPDTPIRRDIARGPVTTLTIDLLTEALRHEKDKQAKSEDRPTRTVAETTR